MAQKSYSFLLPFVIAFTLSLTVGLGTLYFGVYYPRIKKCKTFIAQQNSTAKPLKQTKASEKPDKTDNEKASAKAKKQETKAPVQKSKTTKKKSSSTGNIVGAKKSSSEKEKAASNKTRSAKKSNGKKRTNPAKKSNKSGVANRKN